MTLINTTSCCGLRELDGIMGDDAPHVTMASIASQLVEIGGAFVIFSCPVTHDHGQRLALFIRDNNLGHVIPSSIRRNPNSGNDLQVWLWEVEIDHLDGWINAYNAREQERRVEEERLEAQRLADEVRDQNGGFVVGQTVSHLTFGRGAVRSIRQNANATIGVSFELVTNGHNLNGVLADTDMTGKWCSPRYLQIIE